MGGGTNRPIPISEHFLHLKKTNQCGHPLRVLLLSSAGVPEGKAKQKQLPLQAPEYFGMWPKAPQASWPVFWVSSDHS